MATNLTSVHQNWTSRLAFLLATTGAAVGLGNLWRFPFLTGQNGGAAFILVYLTFVFLISVPVIMAELAIGRMGHLSPVGSIREIVKEQKASRAWRLIGIISLAVPFLGFTYYSVVAGWAIEYTLSSFQGRVGALDADGSLAFFDALIASPGTNILLQGAVIFMTVAVVGGGLHKGIERATRFLMPALFLILVFMVGHNIFLADFTGAAKFLFAPDFSSLNGKAILIALGQAFFSVGVGVGFMMTYGAYLPKNVSVPRAAAVIGGVDTLVALLAGLAIFPIVFATGLNPGEGPGLVFITMPVAFGKMALGHVLGVLFFLLLFMAAFTSTIAMLEPLVSYMEERWRLKRFTLAFGAGTAVWIIGILPSLSGNILQGVRPLDFIEGLREKTVFETFDLVTASFLLPLNAFLISLFAGWVIRTRSFKKELAFKSNRFFSVWQILIRFLAPAAVLAITGYGLFG